MNENKEKFENEKTLILNKHQADIEVWVRDLDKTNKEIVNLKKLDDLSENDLELEKVNEGHKKKVDSLLDTLYGCEECRYHGDFCKCNDLYEHDILIEEDDAVAALESDSPL